ncbi:transposase [Ignatzschineria sp. LJL83]
MVVGLLNRKKLIAPLQYEGMKDSVLFEQWFSMCLIPELPTSSVVIMDNARFYRKTELEKITIAKGHLLLFLAPYFPDLNPIEKYWANLKEKMKQVLPQFSNFNDALYSLF